MCIERKTMRTKLQKRNYLIWKTIQMRTQTKCHRPNKYMYMAFTDSTLTKDPKMLKETMNSPDWPEWEKAIKTELATLKQMGTWELADAPKNRNSITSKWIFMQK